MDKGLISGWHALRAWGNLQFNMYGMYIMKPNFEWNLSGPISAHTNIYKNERKIDFKYEYIVKLRYLIGYYLDAIKCGRTKVCSFFLNANFSNP